MSDEIMLKDVYDLDFNCPRAGVYGRVLLEAPSNPDPEKERRASFIVYDMSNDKPCVTYSGEGKDFFKALQALWEDLTQNEPPYTDDHLEDEMEKVREKLRVGVIEKIPPIM